METIKITFCGAARIVTGSCYLLEHNNIKFLVDCGMFQGNKQIKEHNYGEFPFKPGEIDFVLLTHSHIDHSGLLPKLYKKGFLGPTYATSGTVELCTVMLPDSGHIQEMEVERKNRKLLRSGKQLLSPIYTALEAEECIKFFQKINYNEEFEPAPGIRVTMKDAGHILGSAILEIRIKSDKKEEKIVFTGDLGRSDRPIVNDPAVINQADYLVMESTYGNRLHEEIGNNELTLAEAINNTFRRGGNVVIPAFAVDRTQDLLLALKVMIEEKRIDPKSIYIDSPLAISATEVFCRHTEYFDPETKKIMEKYGGCPFHLPNLNYSRTAEESMAINQINKGAIIISASGMADAGRIKHHLKHNLWRPECTVIFVGYQAEGTLGRRIVDGEKKVTIHGEEIAVNAKIIMLEGYSAHADRNELIHWLEGFGKMPEKMFITHGEEVASLDFAQTVKDRFHVDPLVPFMGDSVDLFAEQSPREVYQLTKQETLDNVSELYNQINRKLKELVNGGLAGKLQEIKDYLEKLSA